MYVFIQFFLCDFYLKACLLSCPGLMFLIFCLVSLFTCTFPTTALSNIFLQANSLFLLIILLNFFSNLLVAFLKLVFLLYMLPMFFVFLLYFGFCLIFAIPKVVVLLSVITLQYLVFLFKFYIS